jgi:hypothetical protein
MVAIARVTRLACQVRTSVHILGSVPGYLKPLVAERPRKTWCPKCKQSYFEGEGTQYGRFYICTDGRTKHPSNAIEFRPRRSFSIYDTPTRGR